MLTRDGRMDEMAVQVEARPEAWGGAHRAWGAELAHHIKSMIGREGEGDGGGAGVDRAVAREGEAGDRQAEKTVASPCAVAGGGGAHGIADLARLS